MRVKFISYKLIAVTPTSVTSSPFESILPDETAEPRNKAELLAALDQYKAKVMATGKPAVVSFVQDKRGGRAFAGFNQMRESDDRRSLVNAESVTTGAMMAAE